MKKKMLKRLLSIELCTVLAVGILGGCGEEKKVNYVIESMESTGENAGETDEENEQQKGETVVHSGLSRFEGEESWKEEWQAKTMERGRDGEIVKDVEMSINAKVSIPEVKQMSVVEVTEVEFDAASKKKIAERIFDSGEIYYADPKYLPEKELQEAWDDFFRDGTYMITCDELGYRSEESEIYLQELQDAQNSKEEPKTTFTLATDYEAKRYLGTYEGKSYHLSFIENAGGDSTNHRRLKQMKLVMKDINEAYPEKFKEREEITYSPWMRGDWIDNQCELSEEEALETAKKFVEQLGLDYPVYAYSRPLLWGTAPEGAKEERETDAWGINGYVFYFSLGVDELPFLDFGVEGEYWDFITYSRGTELQYSMDAKLQVFVTDKGIIQVNANNPMEITEITEGVELLSLDAVKGIMKDAMQEQYEVLKLTDYITTFNGMELIYFRVRDKENPGDYSYVPTWRLSYVTDGSILHQIYVRNQILINAIDGTLIDFYDET